jgi:hypothetical protein
MRLMRFSNKITNIFYYMVGLVLLLMVSLKHNFLGYKSPKPISNSRIDECIDYDLNTIQNWLSLFHRHIGFPLVIDGKHILELGPGSDLGVGLGLLAAGASKYSAIDVNNLAASANPRFYAHLFDKLAALYPGADVKKDFEDNMNGHQSRLNYIVNSDFNLKSYFLSDKIDLVVSQAAFEHFDDIHSTIQQLTLISNPDAIAVITIDLKTHTRWIRERDPNNIYRYSNWIYDSMRFPGMPNRVRPFEYRNAFLNNGWKDVRLIALNKLSDNQYSSIFEFLNLQFRNQESAMEHLDILICASKSKLFS